MGVYYNITIIADWAEEWEGEEDVSESPVFLRLVNDWLAERNQFGLARLDDNAPGQRSVGCYVCSGQNRGMGPPAGFEQFILNFPWQYPEEVVAVIHYEDEATKVLRPKLSVESI